MKNIYWILILVGMIVLACIGGSLTYKITSERWYEYGYEEGYEKGYNENICVCVCEICEDNFEEGEQKCISCVKECYYKYSFGGSRLLICLRSCGIENAELLYKRYIIEKIN